MPASFPREGVLAALAIPTDKEGRLLKTALANHIEWLRERKVHGILALGSTGEFVRFSLDERKAILETIAELTAPLPVLANISDISPSVVAELGRFARELNLPGVAVMPPSFYPVSPADQLAHFLNAAEAFGGPVVLYNFPELTGNRIGIETIAQFADQAQMAGIKQSGGEFSYHHDLIALGQEKGYSVFSGADTRLPKVFAMGAVGCIGGLVNFVPEDMVEIFEIVRQGKAGDTEAPRQRLCEVGEWLGRLTFPLNVTAGLEARGIEVGAPKTLVSPTSRIRYQEIVTGLRGCFERWGFAEAGLK